MHFLDLIHYIKFWTVGDSEKQHYDKGTRKFNCCSKFKHYPSISYSVLTCSALR